MAYNLTRPAVREYAGGSVGGILRKGGSANGQQQNATNSAASTSSAAVNVGETRQVDLLVFGYACKVFRDDEKARDIDQGKHLIPWMGDTALKIDRYDVRGALSDLAPYEPPPGGYGNRLDYLSAEEQRAEQLCEEERYFYLYNNEEEHILQQEEDLKRLKQESSGSAYNQVAFQYDNAAGDAAGVPHGPNREEHSNSPSVEEAFSLPKNFEVPISIQLPETMKQHAIIEKTARFIASQGVQMEILLKAKQSNNAQFEFLSQNSILNPYYKYLVNAIKNGTYPAETVAKDVNDAANAPSAPVSSAASAIPKPVITVPTIKYKPSANCAYTQLISRIKGVPLPEFLADENANAASSSPVTAANNTASSTASPAGAVNFTPVLLQYNGNTFVTADAAAAEDSNSNSNLCASTNSTSSQDTNAHQQPQVEILKNSSALALAQNYSSGSEDEDEEVPTNNDLKSEEPPKPEPVLHFPIPPESLKNIIDKTATYVIKNGRQFEETLRAKSDERFTFLLHDNEFYAYYMYKITGDPDAASKEQKQRKAAAVAAALLSKKGLQTPVSFSIKQKDEPTAATLHTVLPQETSDDEDEKKTLNETAAPAARNVPEHVQKAIQMVERQLLARNEQLAAAAVGGASSGGNISVAPASSAVRSRFDVDYNNGNKSHIKSTKAEMERNALFEQQQQNRQKELKKAEEKVKDKLAQIAREKLGGLITKEKQLQLERKRKAMAFLNQIKGTPPSTVCDDPPSTDAKTKPDDEENASDDSEASVHSIPITSYGPEEKTDDEDDHPPIRVPQTHIAAAVNTAPPSSTQSKTKTTTVTLSDDDDVQLVSETKPIKHQATRRPQQITQKLTHKRRSRSRTYSPSLGVTAHKRSRKRSRHSSVASSGSEDRYASLSSKHKSGSDKTKKSSKSRSHKKKSKKRSRSHSRSRSYSRSRSPNDDDDKRYGSRQGKGHSRKSRQRSRGRSSRSYSVESTASTGGYHKSERYGKRSSETPNARRKEKKRKHER